MDKIRVIHIVLGLEVGGLEKLVVDLASAINKLTTIESIICCITGKDTQFQRMAEAKGVRVINLDSKMGLQKVFSLLSLIQLVRREKIDILHSHNATAHFYGAVVSSFTRKPLIHTKHGNLLPFPRNQGWSSHHWAASSTKKIIAVSDIVRESIINAYRVPAEKVMTIFNGIDIAPYHSKPRLSTLDSKYFSVGCIGRLSKEKDHSTLLKAFKKVLEIIPTVQLKIVGDGMLKEALIKETKDLGIEGNVAFWGMRTDIPDLLKEFDVFVQPSLTEGISLTILEAMAAGLPVVATNVGGNPEVVLEGQTGFLVPSQNPKAMAEAILKFHADKNLAGRFGEAGRKRVEEKFDLNKMVSAYGRVYNSLTNPTDAVGDGQTATLKPKILVFTNVFPRDFEPHKGPNILEQLKRLKEDFDIRIISAHPKSNARIPAKTISHGFEIFQPGYFTLPKIGVLTAGYDYYLTTRPLVRKLRKHFPFDVIISYWTYPDGFAAGIFAKDYDVPLIIRPRGSDINVYLQNPFLKGLIKKALLQADRIIPVTKDLKEKIHALGIPEDKLSVLANGIDTDNFYPRDKQECRQKLNIPLDQMVVLFVGNLIEIKGIEYLLAAINKLDTPDNNKLSFYILGSGKLVGIIKQTSLELKNIRLQLMGEVGREDLPIWMNAADLFCLSSLNEGCPNVLLESLACGVAVVATNVGGIPEIINNERLGILVPAQNADRLAQAIVKGLNQSWNKDDLLARVAGQTWDRVVEQLKMNLK